MRHRSPPIVFHPINVFMKRELRRSTGRRRSALRVRSDNVENSFLPGMFYAMDHVMHNTNRCSPFLLRLPSLQVLIRRIEGARSRWINLKIHR